MCATKKNKKAFLRVPDLRHTRIGLFYSGAAGALLRIQRSRRQISRELHR